MAEDDKESRWTIKLDWLNILSMLNLDNINQITESKKTRAIKKLTSIYGFEKLMTFEPDYIEKLMVKELKEIMKKELALNARKKEKLEREMRNRIIPLKRGGILKIDPKDSEEMLKYLKKFLGDNDDDNDDDKDKYKEDNTGYYI
ncbi:MAG: hypothetical protein ACFFEN_14725 [Candidatus Thorarchaeota archaeon]